VQKKEAVSAKARVINHPHKRVECEYCGPHVSILPIMEESISSSELAVTFNNGNQSIVVSRELRNPRVPLPVLACPTQPS